MPTEPSPPARSPRPRCSAATGARANGLAPSGGFAQFGDAGHTQSLVVGLTWEWQRHWRLGSGRLSGYWEASIGRWITDLDGDGNAWVTQLGITPVFRYRPDGGRSPWFFEGAIGIDLLAPIFRTNDERFSTRWNFGDHLALGRSFGRDGRQEIALRLEHFSNGGIREPNPGANFVQLRYSSRF